MRDNVITLYTEDGRKESWKFPDGTVVTMEVPKDEPPITVKHAIYCFSSLIHQTNEAMKL
jgi:hypothetical protein